VSSHGIYRTETGLLVVLLAAGGITLIISRRAFLLGALRKFFDEPGPAFNLAIIRIVYYATALALSERPTVAWHLAQLPKSLIAAPEGFGWAVPYLPISSSLVLASFFILILTSVTATLGLYTRLSSTVFAIALFYYFTVPQLYGKVDHDHLILWVAVLLALSRTADVWSIDAIRASSKGVCPGSVGTPAPSVLYSRPVRVMWLLIGLTYLLPGMFKFEGTGLQWASPRNMRGILYEKWYQLGGYRPPIPIDHGLLLIVMGAGTMFFETTFLIWILFPRTRLLSPIMGVIFHTATDVALRIGFYSQLALYVSFVNWNNLSERLMRRPAKARLQIQYDGHCPVAAARVSTIQRLALPGAFSIGDLRELRSDGVDNVPKEGFLLVDLDNGDSWRGVHAYRRIAARAPGIWLIITLHWIAGRHETSWGPLRVKEAPPVSSPPVHHRRLPIGFAPSVVGASIFLLSGVAAATLSVNAWPVAVYPTFSGDHSHWVTTNLEVVEGSAGKVVDLQRCMTWLPEVRFVGLLGSIIGRPVASRAAAATSLVQIAQRGCPSLASSADLQVYLTTVSTAPQNAGHIIDRTSVLRLG
jgi:hypothetical protein